MTSDALVTWLLQANTPSIRYLTTKNFRPANHTDSQVSFTEMENFGPIPAILGKQAKSGAWQGEHSFYTPKYKSTHWSMLLLSELAADPSDGRLRRGAEFMLEAALKQPLWWLEEYQPGIACFWANLLRYSLHAGFIHDVRVDAVIGILVDNALRVSWRCHYNHELPCAWGAGRALWGLAAIPIEKRSLQIDAAVQSGLSFLLDEYSLVEANYPVQREGKVNKLWSRLNFPLFYQADILLVLRALAELGELNHPGAALALEWLRDRRTSSGRWRGASPFRQRTWPLGDSQETDRWVSLQAATILDKA